MDKDKGLYKKYEVTKLNNPTKKLDCIVLEFDDPIARVGIRAWADAMAKNGYYACATEVMRKWNEHERGESKAAKDEM